MVSKTYDTFQCRAHLEKLPLINSGENIELTLDRLLVDFSIIQRINGSDLLNSLKSLQNALKRLPKQFEKSLMPFKRFSTTFKFNAKISPPATFEKLKLKKYRRRRSVFFSPAAGTLTRLLIIVSKQQNTFRVHTTVLNFEYPRARVHDLLNEVIFGLQAALKLTILSVKIYYFFTI